MRLSPYAKRNKTYRARHEEAVTGPARGRMRAANRVAAAMANRASTPSRSTNQPAVLRPDQPKSMDVNMTRRQALAQKMARTTPVQQNQKMRIAEDDPRWNAHTMGNRRSGSDTMSERAGDEYARRTAKKRRHIPGMK